ncbi:MAG: radical SAM protein [Catenulispora sp.]|nr:radical SAM protein [Catenulispora sp.]
MSPDLVGHRNGVRLLAGSKNFWFLGPGGIARVGSGQVSPEGRLTPGAEDRLRERGLYEPPQEHLYSLTVLTSTDCNLGCGYCFQNTGPDLSGGNRPPRITHARLTSEDISSILGFAGRQMAEAGLDRLSILLFGGEPLMNPRGCVELLTRAADYGLASAWMISNATLLTPKVAKDLWDAKLRFIQVTFDGDQPDHDQIRVRRSNGGTFDAIIRNMRRASEAAPLAWALRVNVSHRNHRGIDNLLNRLADSLDPARCTISFDQIRDMGVGYTNDLDYTRNLSASFARWQRQALELGFKVPRPKANTPCRTCGYGDGRYGAVANADGTLSSCWETAGKPGWEVGSTEAGYLPTEVTKDRWISCGDMYDPAPDDEDVAAFRDSVDAALLDYLAETGRL